MTKSMQALPISLDPYPRDPMFWEAIDGDIDAIPIVLPSGRPVNSDVMALEHNAFVAGSGLYREPFRAGHELLLIDAETMREWMQNAKVSAATQEFVMSIPGIELIPGDEASRRYLTAGDVTRDHLLGRERIRRAVGSLLWGGESLVNITLWKARNTPLANKSVPRSINYPDFRSGEVSILLKDEWRLSAPVSYREVIYAIARTQHRFSHERLLLGELVYAVAHDRRGLMNVMEPSLAFWQDELALRAATIEDFRSVVNDYSALAWLVYLYHNLPESRYGGYTGSTKDNPDVRRRIADLLAIARRVPFGAARPYMDCGVFDGALIADAIDDRIDADMLAAVSHGA